ncbi:MAG: SdiA-regulated domain-containing protein [Phycisphaerae bacterium]|nr:SdiA-regulated domain-containing protein [Saprospiraceae bacterium]
MQKLPVLSFGLAFPALVLCFCNTQQPTTAPRPDFAVVTDSLPYDLQNPSLTINLVSEALKEISGLSPTDLAGVYLAIADERGEVFFVEGNSGGSVSRRVLFRDKGDFESVEMVGKSIWAAKSNGDMYEITDWEKNPPHVEEFKTSLKKHNDVEGLAYDPWRKALLLACKEQPDSLYPRGIYVFNLETKTLDESPAYTIHPEEVNRLVSYGEVERHEYFSPSGLAVHPLTGDVYVVSTALKRLVVLDYKTGKIKFAQRLDKKILPQPEGISFDAQGNLLLSSEGKLGEGMLLKFDFKGKK